MNRRKRRSSYKNEVSMKWPFSSDAKIKSHLNNFDNFIGITVSSDEYKYKLGDFKISLQNNLTNTDIIYMCYKKFSPECFVYWKELKKIGEVVVYKLDDQNVFENSEDSLPVETKINADERNMSKSQQKRTMKNQNNGKQHSENSQVVFSYGTCSMPYELLDSLSTKSQFDLILDAKCTVTGCLDINVFINPSSIRTLSYAAQPLLNRHQVKVQMVIEHFYGIFVEEYENEFVDEEKHVESIYRCIRNCYDSNKEAEVAHSHLIPQLRAYQSQAVHWMLRCETEIRNEINHETHILYYELNLCDNTKIFYHKYNGLFVEQKFTPLPLFKGGILADEMGLGKTIEVLALILLHPRINIPESKSIVYTANTLDYCTDDSNSIALNSFVEGTVVKKRKTSVNSSDKSFTISSEDSSFSIDEQSCSSSETCFQEVYKPTKKSQIKFECVCGSSYKRNRMTIVECHKCYLVQHAQCVLADATIEKRNYICPYCWVDSTVEPVKSRSTLIVSPSAILYQWEHEILRHLKPDSLKVFTYLGVDNHKFISPLLLADNDIVLTSYEIFRKEFSHVNVPHGKNQRIFRNPKKFRTLPSPLSAVEWWRICLDEAQMVESVSSKVAKMALELHCVNKWCVTGTPIQKSVEDLYGLLLFLGYDPYQEKDWWRKLLCKPFANGVTDNLISVLNNIVWRTDKISVLDQMAIPEQETVLHKIQLSKVERVFYERMLDSCRSDFLEKIRKYSCEDCKLKAIDKHVLSKILLPLKKLEQACCHFQLTGDKFANVERCKMTIPELLNHLLKNASYECEEKHRKLILALNGLAGTFSIKEEYKSACDMYKKVLHSIEENKETVRTDSLQQIHALHNYSEVLKIWVNSVADVTVIQETIQNDNIETFCDELARKCFDFCKTYLIKFEAVAENCKQTLCEIDSEINKIKSEFIFANDISSNWYFNIFKSMDEKERTNFVDKIKDFLIEHGSNFIQEGLLSMQNSFRDINGLQYSLWKREEDLHCTRSSLVEAVKSLITVPTQLVINSAIECHLRPTSGLQVTKCVYCKADDTFNRYESRLYCFKDVMDCDDVTSDTEDICFKKLRRGTHADSELESGLKFLLNYCRHKIGFSNYLFDGNNVCKLFDALKKEFKLLRNTWIKMCEYVAAVDELEMAKTSMRLLLPGEETSNPPLPHVIVPHELEGNILQLESDAASYHYEFKKRLGQLFYLQNLKKAENMDGPFEESCPVCCLPFEGSWCVLQCGHNFCPRCIQRLNQKLDACRNGIRCPICRENTTFSDVYFLESRPSIDEDIDIKGRYSTKISAVVKTLISIQKQDTEAKSLVFSSWKNLLLILENALNENEINFVSLTNKQGKTFQMAIDEFKLNQSCKVLLLPLKVGANGLNLVEAKHVLLVEPILDQSKVLQAVGRVHRIGQTKKTVVHKFVVKNSIEENIYEVHKNESFSIEDPHETINLSLTVQDLKGLFEVHEELF